MEYKYGYCMDHYLIIHDFINSFIDELVDYVFSIKNNHIYYMIYFKRYINNIWEATTFMKYENNTFFDKINQINNNVDDNMIKYTDNYYKINNKKKYYFQNKMIRHYIVKNEDGIDFDDYNNNNVNDSEYRNFVRKFDKIDMLNKKCNTMNKILFKLCNNMTKDEFISKLGFQSKEIKSTSSNVLYFLNNELIHSSLYS